MLNLSDHASCILIALVAFGAETLEMFFLFFWILAKKNPPHPYKCLWQTTKMYHRNILTYLEVEESRE